MENLNNAVVHAGGDLTISVSFTDSKNKNRVSGELNIEGARELMAALLMRFDPCVEQLRVILLRHGLFVVNNDAIEKRFGIAEVLPDTFRGIYITKTSANSWLFGRAKSGVVCWEKTELNDLLDLGIKIDDVKNIVPDVVYRLPFVGELRSV